MHVLVKTVIIVTPKRFRIDSRVWDPGFQKLPRDQPDYKPVGKEQYGFLEYWRKMTCIFYDWYHVRYERGHCGIGRVRLLNLRITPSFLENEELTLRRCSAHMRFEEKWTPRRRSVCYLFITTSLKIESGWAILFCAFQMGVF